MPDPRHAILFEPLRIGPKTAKNRFYQVPHCNGMGHREPKMLAAMRGMKAEGGWAVVCTEEVEIHPSSEVSPSIEGRIWSDEDIPVQAQVVEAIHAHGALAGIELVYNTPRANLISRMVPMGASALPVYGDYDPVQARAMDRDDIRALRRWHRNAALRAKRAGYDLIYVYCGHGLTLTQQFLSRATNDRTDEYGGSLENRARLLRELIEDTREAVGDTCAVPVRIAVEELQQAAGLDRTEIEDVIGMLGELPDLWDFCMGAWSEDSATSRFSGEGFQEPFVRGLKQLTSKPVVGVGRFTSPEAMVAQIKGGILDFVGAARPSIADPFLPRKIEEGRAEDLRECIGCNICTSGDNQSAPIRCTQNPTMGEEWRRGWHPEHIAPAKSQASILIVGGGPAGLEAARALGQRGYAVTLADAQEEMGGRLVAERRLPGLAAWGRVIDYRLGQIEKLPNVSLYPASTMTAADVLGFGASHVVLATGSAWRRDGVGRQHPRPLPLDLGLPLLTPDDLMAGKRPAGHVVLYDDDHYYMGGVLAELLVTAGARVTLVTPALQVSSWTRHTLEQRRIEERLRRLGVALITEHALEKAQAGGVTIARTVLGEMQALACDALVLVTARLPTETLWQDLKILSAQWREHGVAAVTRIGDALAPATIAHAVHAGHLYARMFDEVVDPDAVPFRRQVVT